MKKNIPEKSGGTFETSSDRRKDQSGDRRGCKTEDFLKFLQCESGKRMHQAAKKKQLYKEQPFVLGVDSGEIYPDTECRSNSFWCRESLDVYFEEEGRTW